MYEYRAFVRKVYDGDTITVDFDLGFGITLSGQKVRLLGINTPEVRGPERPSGLVSRDALRNKIGNKWVTIKTHKDRRGKYGRWLAEVFIEVEGSSANINEWLLAEGLAVKYEKKKKK